MGCFNRKSDPVKNPMKKVESQYAIDKHYQGWYYTQVAGWKACTQWGRSRITTGVKIPVQNTRRESKYACVFVKEELEDRLVRG